MTVDTKLSAQEMIVVDNAVNLQNSKNIAANGRVASSELGKDDFLKLLIAQLANQDPTSPMENTEFIAQMAQFSSLEQMTNMSTSFSKMAGIIASSEASSMVGKTVEVDVNGEAITGTVDAATRGEHAQVLVNGIYYDLDRLNKVYAN